MTVTNRAGKWRLFFVVISAGAAGLGIVDAQKQPEPISLARQQCAASGASDGFTAVAWGWCLHRPDGTTVGASAGLDCDQLTYELAIANDAELAVFPDAVVRNYFPTLRSADGPKSNDGTIIDVTQVPYEPGSPAPSPTYDRPILVAQNLAPGSRLFSATGRWWNRTCWTTSPEGALAGTVEGPFGEGPVVPFSDLVAAVAARLNPPPLPPVRHAGPASITQLETWFWIDATWWEADFSASASHGLVLVTVRATPAEWLLRPVNPPRGPLLVCRQQGIDYRPDSDAEGCTATFTEPPPGGEVDLRAEVELDVAWSTTLPGYGLQNLPPLFRSSVISHSVVEVAGLRSG